ncbi:uncharacterized protein LOC142445281 [Tenrec ecaudatus]|uniref:uncharacterized protein LOC142445281 n=1 Tax=Tenrec ecaudatus TaxID=94439 RepID=UPI003F5A2DA1
MRHLKVVSNAAVLTAQQIQRSNKQEVNLQTRCSTLQKEALELHSQVDTLGLRLQAAVTEMDNYKEMLRTKSNEADDCQRKLRKLEFESVISESRHTRLLKEKEESLAYCQQSCKTLQEQLAAKEGQEEDMKRQINLMEKELELTKTLLSQTKEEMATLKNERELMLVSHQKSTEQLQESVRQKLLSDADWRAKIEAELTKERARHLVEFEEQALLFKEEAKLILDIEKEKYEEMIQKYQKEQEELQTKIPDLVAEATRDLKREVVRLQEKLCESRTRYAQEAELKEKEMEKLRSLAAECESRLKEEIDSNGSVSGDLRKEVKEKSEELERVTLAQAQLKQQFQQSQEENTFLQETVRRECEERFELTEALSLAREQLLELTKLSGRLPLSPCPLGQGRVASPAVAAGKHGEKSLARPNSEKGIKPPCLQQMAKPALSPERPPRMSSTALPLLPQPHPPRGRASSVTDTRQRLAAILRRRMSQQ